MKKTLLALVFNILAIASICQAQSSWHCTTTTDNPVLLSVEKPQLKGAGITANCDKQIRVYFHIVRTSTGTGGFTSTQVSQLVTNLNSDYSTTGISFIEKGRGYIDNNYYYTGSYDDTKFNQLVAVNRQSDAINIYLVQTDYGRADNIPGTALVIGGNFVLTSVLSHEMGHCIGLYHTHRGTVSEGGGGPTQCAELVNGSNGSTCGDYVSDTPADPNKWSGCNYIGTGTDANGQTYHPSTSNIMSYVAPSCLTQLTAGQISRIHASLEGSASLKATYMPDISGPSQFCISSTYSISNLPTGSTVTWSASPSNIVSISTSNNVATVTKIGNGMINLSATINRTCGSLNLPAKQVSVGTYSAGDFPISGQTNICSNTVSTYSVTGLPGATNYNWVIPPNALANGWSIVTGQGTPVLTVITGSVTATLKLKVSNNCGESIAPALLTVNINSCGSFSFVASPNPTSNTLNVSQNSASSQIQANTTNVNGGKISKPFSVKLFDQNSKILKSLSSERGDDIAINTSDIPNGTYFLHIFQNKETIKKQIIIQH